MTASIDQNLFSQALLDIFDEVFETHHGIFLDKGSSLFDMLESISSVEASRPVGGKCASLAAQVAHVAYYLDVLEHYILEQDTGKVDWSESWRTVQEVTPQEWVDLKLKLRQEYGRMLATFRDLESWNNENAIGGAMAIVVHSAYHLGEIRQALCTIKE